MRKVAALLWLVHQYVQEQTHPDSNAWSFFLRVCSTRMNSTTVSVAHQFTQMIILNSRQFAVHTKLYDNRSVRQRVACKDLLKKAHSAGIVVGIDVFVAGTGPTSRRCRVNCSLLAVVSHNYSVDLSFFRVPSSLF